MLTVNLMPDATYPIGVQLQAAVYQMFDHTKIPPPIPAFQELAGVMTNCFSKLCLYIGTGT